MMVAIVSAVAFAPEQGVEQREALCTRRRDPAGHGAVDDERRKGHARGGEGLPEAVVDAPGKGGGGHAPILPGEHARLLMPVSCRRRG